MARAIQICLEQNGYCIAIAKDAAEGDEVARSDRYDAMVVDVNLPDGNGVDLCSRFRRQKIGAPILIPSVLATTADKVRGLDAGADDYLTEPIQAAELLARLCSLLRRSYAIEGGSLQAADLRINLIERMVSSRTFQCA